MNSVDCSKLGPADLQKVGKALFGDRWQTDLANALGLSSPRRLRQWMSGERKKIPAGIWVDVCALLRQRQISIGKALGEISIGIEVNKP